MSLLWVLVVVLVLLALFGGYGHSAGWYSGGPPATSAAASACCSSSSSWCFSCEARSDHRSRDPRRLGQGVGDVGAAAADQAQRVDGARADRAVGGDGGPGRYRFTRHEFLREIVDWRSSPTSRSSRCRSRRRSAGPWRRPRWRRTSCAATPRASWSASRPRARARSGRRTGSSPSSGRRRPSPTSSSPPGCGTRTTRYCTSASPAARSSWSAPRARPASRPGRPSGSSWTRWTATRPRPATRATRSAS